jgi:hypothetical protein
MAIKPVKVPKYQRGDSTLLVRVAHRPADGPDDLRVRGRAVRRARDAYAFNATPSGGTLTPLWHD